MSLKASCSLVRCLATLGCTRCRNKVEGKGAAVLCLPCWSRGKVLASGSLFQMCSHPEPYPECCSVNPGLPLSLFHGSGAALHVLSLYSAYQDGDKELPLNGKLLLASDLPGRVTEAFVQQGGKVCSPSSATLRPRSPWADGRGFYSMGGC